MTAAERPQKDATVLLAENRRLRERLLEMERLVGGVRSGPLDKSESRMFRLVKEKDRALAQYADRLEKKTHELQNVIRSMEETNRKLNSSLAVLRMYELIFENEPAGILGVDTAGRVAKFNSSAIRLLGVDLHGVYMRDVGTVHLARVARPVDLRTLFDHAMAEGRWEESLPLEGGGMIELRVYRLEDHQGVRGVVFRLEEIDEPPAAPEA